MYFMAPFINVKHGYSLKIMNNTFYEILPSQFFGPNINPRPRLTLRTPVFSQHHFLPLLVSYRKYLHDASF